MPKTCNCGSGLPREELTDARGIFIAFVCDKCKKKVEARYRPEIFTDNNYEAEEPIEPEDY